MIFMSMAIVPCKNLVLVEILHPPVQLVRAKSALRIDLLVPGCSVLEQIEEILFLVPKSFIEFSSQAVF